MFVNFDNVLQTTRRKLPFGIAAGQILSETRSPPATSFSAAASSNRMEMEYFVKPGTDESGLNTGWKLALTGM